MRLLLMMLLAGVVAPGSAQAPAGGGTTYHVARKIPIGGEGPWDYLTYDAARHRLFLSHARQVDVVDEASGQVIGRIPETLGVHGIALAQELGRGFVSDGRDSTVTIFDLRSLEVTTRVRVPGRNPDAILYDSTSRRVLTFNGGSANATALDAATGRVVGTVALGGKPEFAVADGHGGVFVNIEDRSEIVGLDAATLTVRTRWPLAGCEDPTGLALDLAHQRLFSTCGNARMAVLDAVTGRIIALLPIGRGVDGCAFDPATRQAFASNGEGTITVVQEELPDSFRVLGDVVTQRGARTMTLDSVTHRLYTVTAAFGPAPAPSAEQAHPRPSILPGSFTLLVLER